MGYTHNCQDKVATLVSVSGKEDIPFLSPQNTVLVQCRRSRQEVGRNNEIYLCGKHSV